MQIPSWRALIYASFLLALVSPVSTGITPGNAAAASSDEAADAAYQFSVWESEGQYDLLYDAMHPDAQIIIPRATVEWFYITYFAPSLPQPASITGVEIVNWTWPVNQRTYSNTAEVSFRQEFAAGSPVTDIVRLVEGYDGEWHWFFGRTTEFIDTMNFEAVEAGWIDWNTSLLDATGISADHLFGEAIVAITSVQPDCFSIDSGSRYAPDTVQGSVKQKTNESREARVLFSYPPAEPVAGGAYPDLIVNGIDPSETGSPEAEAEAIKASITNWTGPEYSLPPRALAVDLASDSDYFITYYEEYSEPFGHVSVLTWGERGQPLLFAVAGPKIEIANELLSHWITNQIRDNRACLT